MATLDKEKVLAAFSAAYEAKHGKAPEVEQKGSWYAIDGGKSVRLADLDAMTQELTGDAPAAKPAAKKAAPKAAAKTAPAKKPAAAKVSAGNGGLSPAAFWEDQLEQRDHHCRRPRGF